MKSNLQLAGRALPVWAVIVSIVLVGSLAVGAYAASSNSKVGFGEVKAQQRLLITDWGFSTTGQGTCTTAPNADSIQCETLAYAGDVGELVFSIRNNANTPTVALITISSDIAVEWAVIGNTVGAVREVGTNQFAFSMPATCTGQITFKYHVFGVAPDGIYQFAIAITPEI